MRDRSAALATDREVWGVAAVLVAGSEKTATDGSTCRTRR